MRRLGKTGKTLVGLSESAIGKWRFWVRFPKRHGFEQVPYREYETQHDAKVAAFDWLEANGGAVMQGRGQSRLPAFLAFPRFLRLPKSPLFAGRKCGGAGGAGFPKCPIPLGNAAQV